MLSSIIITGELNTSQPSYKHIKDKIEKVLIKELKETRPGENTTRKSEVLDKKSFTNHI